jgi:hypothetical protein
MSNIEQEKFLVDYLKHITTLSTGSILLIMGFVEKLFKSPEYKYLVGISLSFFLLTILGSLIVYTLSLARVEGDAKRGGKLELMEGYSGLLMFVSFFIGLISISAFFFINYY